MDATNRLGFLEDACADDEALRREVESLLAQDQAAESFMETPALQLAGKLLANVVRLDTTFQQSTLQFAACCGMPLSFQSIRYNRFL